ncbi:MAG: cytidylate kinase family protein [Nitrososphaerota archaeon]|nr:cytidylate kinase family protein [Nitrososphaerota archaeon]MDG6966712.1 cytidylate kinase family protein [Nitrososphaerota archaeon]MDG6979227.1 cytidylate kinase family protein [Nitrososphaerota archaeon]
MKAIILCGMPAVGKTTVAKMIASRLGLKLVGGGDILKEIALEEGYNAVGDDWWDTGEGMRFMQERKGSPEFDKEVDRRLLAKARTGDVVMTSYTLPWLSKHGVKVWLSGSKGSRAQRMAKRDSSSPEECAKVIDARDGENNALYRKLYGIDFGNDLSPFDIVVGTDGVPAAEVAESVLKQLKGVEGPKRPRGPARKAAKSKARRRKSGRRPSS